LIAKLKNEGAEFVKSKNELLSLLKVSVEKIKIAKEERDRLLNHLKPGEIHKETEIQGKDHRK
jgi:hypothetical protein